MCNLNNILQYYLDSSSQYLDLVIIIRDFQRAMWFEDKAQLSNIKILKGETFLER